MERKDLTFFVKKLITLRKADGFILKGTITKLNDNSIIFETDQATSLIDITNIKEVVLKKEANNGKG